jgi:hypothetical protein
MQSIFGHFPVSEFFNSHSLYYTQDARNMDSECNGLYINHQTHLCLTA